MQPLNFLILILATFYIAHAMTSTHGPAGLFTRLRERYPAGGLTTCLVCLSPWAAGVLWVMLLTPADILVWLLAAAGASVLLYRYTGGAHV